MKDYYKILEIHPEASLEVMNNAYRALVRKYHPDLYHSRNKAPMQARMQEINEAYNVLNTPTSRAEYDRRYREWRHTQTNAQPFPAKSLRASLGKVLLWGVGSFIFVKFLLQPLLVNPILRLLLLFGLVVALVRIYGRPRRP